MDIIQSAMILWMLPVLYCVFSIIFFGMIMYENKCPNDTGRMTNGFFFFFMLLLTCHLAIFGVELNRYVKERNKPEGERKSTIGSLVGLILTSLLCILSVYYANEYCRDNLFWTVIIFPVIIFFIAYFLYVKMISDITTAILQ